MAITILLALGLSATPVHALAQMKASEPDLKAAIIINMAMFIDWPPQGVLPSDQLHVCFLDNSPVAVALANAQGRIMRNRTIKVSKIPLNGLTRCHVVYLSSDNREQLPEILSVLQNAPVLITGDSPDLFKRGTMLNLEQSSGHIVFDIDLRSAQKAGLQISSKALRLARQVIE